MFSNEKVLFFKRFFNVCFCVLGEVVIILFFYRRHVDLLTIIGYSILNLCSRISLIIFFNSKGCFVCAFHIQESTYND